MKAPTFRLRAVGCNNVGRLSMHKARHVYLFFFFPSCPDFNPSEQSLQNNIPHVCIHCVNMPIGPGLRVILCSHSISAGRRTGAITFPYGLIH